MPIKDGVCCDLQCLLNPRKEGSFFFDNLLPQGFNILGSNYLNALNLEIGILNTCFGRIS